MRPDQHMAHGYAFVLDDIFKNFNTRKLKFPQSICRYYTYDYDKKLLSQTIFMECVKLVLEDIIENNVTFKLPTGKRKSYIHVHRIAGEDFKNCRKYGMFRKIDFLKTNFSGFRLALVMVRGGRERIKLITANNRYEDKLIEYTHQGKQYC